MPLASIPAISPVSEKVKRAPADSLTGASVAELRLPDVQVLMDQD